jgi:hypothetical protein
MTWAIHVVNGLFLLWIIGGVASRPSSGCQADAYLSKQDCIAASDAGTAIGVGLIVFLWFMAFIVMSLVWFMTRPRGESSVA